MGHQLFKPRNRYKIRFLHFSWCLSLGACLRASSTSSSVRQQLLSDLQSCYTARQVLDRVGRHVTSQVDSDGTLTSLIWVRLCKLLVQEDNQNQVARKEGLAPTSTSLDGFEDGYTILEAMNLQVLRRAMEASSIGADAAVEWTKAASIVSRILSTSASSSIYRPIADFWGTDRALTMASCLQPHHISGLKWAYDSFSLICPFYPLPEQYKSLHDKLDLPFVIIPGCVKDEDLSVPNLRSQVNFRSDEIRTSTNLAVQERRQTAWQGDSGVADFLYSGKSMPREKWSPLVKSVRDELATTIRQRYDCCLLNLYPDGDSGMRYHIDPDQGTLWDYDTAVVSVGSTRRVAFRSINRNQRKDVPHSFHVMHGDVMHMFEDCQVRFQHTVKKAESKGDNAPRASLVFKRTLAK